MSNICTFLQGICSLLNKKAILKKCYRTCAVFTAGAAVVAVVSLTDKGFGSGGKNSISAKAGRSLEMQLDLEETAEDETAIQLDPEAVIPAGEEARSLTAPLLKIGAEAVSEETKNEEETVETEMVAEATAEVETAGVESNRVETVMQENTSRAIPVTEKEYEILLRIVEAEATDEDVKGKMLVANVVLNRVASECFPDDIESVVFQKSNGKYQFSPIKDGRYYKVDITETTRLAVDRVLAGEDESMGALFFACRKLANPKNMRWFDENLTSLFQYGCHEFFTYPS